MYKKVCVSLVETGNLNLQIKTKAEKEPPGRKRTLLKEQEVFPEEEMHALSRWQKPSTIAQNRTTQLDSHICSYSFKSESASWGFQKATESKGVCKSFPALRFFSLPQDLGALQTLMPGTLVEEQEGA